MRSLTICIAGKNNIAINCMNFVIEYVEKDRLNNIKLIGIPNATDSGVDGYYPSYRKFLIEKKIEICKLEDLYSIENLFFFSVEFEKIIDVNKFVSNNLFNIHFSLLPKYKGVYTSALPILFDERESGVTLHKIDHGIDTGDIIAQLNFTLDEKETCDSLYNKYMHYGFKIFKNYFPKILRGEYKAKKQSSKNSTYFSKKSIDYKNLKIDLNKTAYEIGKQIRAYLCPAYQYPKIYDYEIEDYVILEDRSICKPGNILEDKEDYIIISTIDYNIKLIKRK